MADQLVAMFPQHLHYVEPFAGGLSVLLARDPEGVSEVVNDLDGQLTTFWRVLQDPVQFAEMQYRLTMTPASQVEYDWAEYILAKDPIEWSAVLRACAFFVCCRQSMAGRMQSFTPLTRTRTRRGMNELASAWLSAIDGLPAVHERLRRVVIRNRPALEVIRQEDGPDTFFYADPPYAPTTRTAPNVYAHEMTVADHEALLTLLRSVEGKVMLSWYPSDLYDTALAGWHVHDFHVSNHAASGKVKRKMVERVWMNYQPPSMSVVAANTTTNTLFEE